MVVFALSWIDEENGVSDVFYMPGKCGDTLHQWPVAYWWARETGKQFEVWIDEPTSKMLEGLLAAQPCVSKVRLWNQSTNYTCGGQPWGGDFPTALHQEHSIRSLGLRGFPRRQLTLEALEGVALNIHVEPEALAETPSLIVPELPKAHRVVLHGMGICPHTRQTPGFWRFLAGIAEDLEQEFEEVVFVGSPDDREVGITTWPDWSQWSDGGDFLQLASYLQASRLMIGCGSAPVVLASLLKVPAIRVHDPLGNAPAVIWSNLGHNQRNATEDELRSLWLAFKETYACRSTDGPIRAGLVSAESTRDAH